MHYKQGRYVEREKNKLKKLCIKKNKNIHYIDKRKIMRPRKLHSKNSINLMNIILMRKVMF